MHGFDTTPALPAAAAGKGRATAIRRAVADAWNELLRGRGLAEDLPFDASGGDSLRLLRFVFQLEEQLDTPLPLGAFNLRMRPSDYVQTLERLLAGTSERAADRPRVFMIPVRCGDHIGEASFCYACADAIDIVPITLPDWPTFAGQQLSTAALLDRLVADVERQATAEPILLMGYCFGGMLAYGVAQRLEAAGRRVGFLGILDADVSLARSAMPPPKLRERLQRLYWARYRGHLLNDLALNAAAAIASRPRLLRRFAQTRWIARSIATYAPYLNRYLQSGVPQRIDRAGLARMLNPDVPLAAPVVVFRTDCHAPAVPADLHWAPLCSTLTTVAIGGDHDVFRPDRLPGLVTTLTLSLRQVLRQAADTAICCT